MYYFATFLLNDLTIKELNPFSNGCMLIASSRCSGHEEIYEIFRMPPPLQGRWFLKTICSFSLLYQMCETVICLYFCCFEIAFKTIFWLILLQGFKVHLNEVEILHKLSSAEVKAPLKHVILGSQKCKNKWDKASRRKQTKNDRSLKSFVTWAAVAPRSRHRKLQNYISAVVTDW